MMLDIGSAIESVSPVDPGGSNTAARCRADYQMVVQGRWAVIEDTHAPSEAYSFPSSAYDGLHSCS